MVKKRQPKSTGKPTRSTASTKSASASQQSSTITTAPVEESQLTPSPVSSSDRSLLGMDEAIASLQRQLSDRDQQLSIQADTNAALQIQLADLKTQVLTLQANLEEAQMAVRHQLPDHLQPESTTHAALQQPSVQPDDHRNQLQEQLLQTQQELAMQHLAFQNLQRAYARQEQQILVLQDELSQSQTLAHFGSLQLNRWQRTFSR